MFHGIIIGMDSLDNQSHHLPHLPARFAEFGGAVDLADGEVLAGELLRKQPRLVQAWIELHRDELFADWALAVSGRKPYRIAPL
jgi:hypothetical protein